MILSDKMIKAAMTAGDIVIEPFDSTCLGSNSYDVHLAPTLVTYRRARDGEIQTGDRPIWNLDAKWEPEIVQREIPAEGVLLNPGVLYLGATTEYTESHQHVPFLDGKSSIGRLGITIHCTAGRGDVGFAGHWTLEIHVVQPVRVYAGMPIGQLIYFETGEVETSYDKKSSAKYNNRSAVPQPSQMWRNFDDGKR